MIATSAELLYWKVSRSLALADPKHVQKLPVAIATPAECEYVYTVDAFGS